MIHAGKIKEICLHYQVEVREIGSLIDSSHGDGDKRYHYPINDKYFLKINNHQAMDEAFYRGMDQMNDQYRSMGVYCPSLYKTRSGTYIYSWTQEGETFYCHLEEKAAYKAREGAGEVDYDFKAHMLGHLGQYASRFKNRAGCDHYGMWSLIHLSTMDDEVDEKQANVNSLIQVLRDHGYQDLAQDVYEMNDQVRHEIQGLLDDLPFAVFQSDLNDSNILVDDQGTFKGLIDFNLYGRDIIINNFLNETMYFMTLKDYEDLDSQEILTRALSIQDRLMAAVLSHYDLSQVEKTAYKAYRKAILIGFWPSLCLWRSLLKEGKHVDKVLGVIQSIIDL